MKRLGLTVFAALAICAPARAELVTLQGSGLLSTAYGTYRIGDAFSFEVIYDDAATGRIDFGTNQLLTDAAKRITSHVRSDTLVNENLYFTAYNYLFSTLMMGPSSSVFTRANITIDVRRGDQTFALPRVAELLGKAGTFSIIGMLSLNGSGNLVSSGGTGNFVITTVPEPASWAMLIAGFGMAGAALRQRARKVAVA